MNWIVNFLTSSIGRKLIMSLTGLFLILFLVVHLAGNLQLLTNDGGEAFNTYAYFMTHNPLIKFISYGNYFFIILHAVIGILLYFKNRKAKGSSYAVSGSSDETSWSSKNMALLGTLILAFIFIHMGDFWFKMKFGNMPDVMSASLGVPVKDLFTRVSTAFDNPVLVIIYLIGQVVLAFHLWHGFASAFQTLGLNHPKYTPIIQGVGKIIAILIPLGFALIPTLHYLDIYLF
ncbi:succinate dehydrogenase cytochrome b subunit [Portibacter marinus]|uniref:succinate dehydrogenase cytochrome b subunit n=1 Tax=Portibacter marinus TaxID=2898660 RepID=UPI001F449F9E|nr:succinate dehydrogenase cytochrome b subunit [Portibacter marinus]